MFNYVNKIKLNLDYYSGRDLYSDGDIEDELLEIVKNNKDYEEVLLKDNRWPLLYHLSSIRENIIAWYPFEAESKILEIGSGCGAITGALLKSGAQVTSIDLSKKRSLINAYRHDNLDNLEIIVGNFNDIKLEEKYDYITLIGVLEYARLYTNTETPYIDFLKTIRNYLKPGGKLIIAIENKYGLKYFAGCREDHYGNYFSGIEGYVSDNTISTFSKKELVGILEASGFNQNKFFYPYPDYKFPKEIFSDKVLPKKGQLMWNVNNYDRDRMVLFDELAAFDNIIENQMFDFFSNSYLVFAEFQGE
jgi:2-polyprenyl-3-methyl-5-hydroxy-6-metoxy-1,4-benzoquinol methylase